MKVYLNPSSELHSQTILHLQGWIEALDEIMDSQDCPFDTTHELAMQLDQWREEFQKNSGDRHVEKEPVVIITYADQVILVCNQQTGEYIKLTVIPHQLWKQETSLSAKS